MTNEQSERIQALGRELEARTGVEFLAAVVGKCDTYPEIPWKAFALGAAVGAVPALAHAFMQPQWLSGWSGLIHTGWVLGTGAVAALLTPFWNAFARLFLDRERAGEEARQYAQGLFLERGLFNTDHRQAVLVMIGLFEHQVVVLPDIGVQQRLPREDLESAIQCMTPHLRQGNPFQAMVEGIGRIETALVEAGFKAGDDARNQIPDTVIQQKGDAS